MQQLLTAAQIAQQGDDTRAIMMALRGKLAETANGAYFLEVSNGCRLANRKRRYYLVGADHRTIRRFTAENVAQAVEKGNAVLAKMESP